jgi:hypothetical protein
MEGASEDFVTNLLIKRYLNCVRGFHKCFFQDALWSLASAFFEVLDLTTLLEASLVGDRMSVGHWWTVF